MHRAKQILDSTDNRREYRAAQKAVIPMGCPYCPPNRGCNRPYGRPWKIKSWKRYRKTQYKIKEM